MKKILFMILSLFICTTVYATDYYVSSAGDDANAGTSEGAPWLTLAKVATEETNFNAGDNIYFRRGDAFSGWGITLTQKGASGNPITYGAYGTGPKPIIEGNGSNQNLIFMDQATTDFYITFQDLEMRGATQDVFKLGNADYTQAYQITLDNLTVHDADRHCINIQSSNITVQNSEIYDCGEEGIWFQGNDVEIDNNLVYKTAQSDPDGDVIQGDDASGAFNLENFNIHDNVLIHDGKGTKGIIVVDGADTAGSFFQDNVCIGGVFGYGGGQQGVVISGNIFASGRVPMNEAIKLTTNVDIYNNIIIDALDAIENSGTETGVEVYNNTIINPRNSCVKVSTSGSSMTYKNNICIVEDSNDRYIDTASGMTFTSDYNIWWGGTETPVWDYAGTEYSTLATYQSASSQDSNSFYIDPELDLLYFPDPESEAIDNGDTIAGITTDQRGQTRPSNTVFDIGAIERQY